MYGLNWNCRRYNLRSNEPVNVTKKDCHPSMEKRLEYFKNIKGMFVSNKLRVTSSQMTCLKPYSHVMTTSNTDVI